MSNRVRRRCRINLNILREFNEISGSMLSLTLREFNEISGSMLSLTAAFSAPPTAPEIDMEVFPAPPVSISDKLPMAITPG